MNDVETMLLLPLRPLLVYLLLGALDLTTYGLLEVFPHHFDGFPAFSHFLPHAALLIVAFKWCPVFILPTWPLSILPDENFRNTILTKPNKPSFSTVVFGSIS